LSNRRRKQIKKVKAMITKRDKKEIDTEMINKELLEGLYKEQAEQLQKMYQRFLAMQEELKVHQKEMDKIEGSLNTLKELYLQAIEKEKTLNNSDGSPQSQIVPSSKVIPQEEFIPPRLKEDDSESGNNV